MSYKQVVKEWTDIFKPTCAKQVPDRELRNYCRIWGRKERRWVGQTHSLGPVSLSRRRGQSAPGTSQAFQLALRLSAEEELKPNKLLLALLFSIVLCVHWHKWQAISSTPTLPPILQKTDRQAKSKSNDTWENIKLVYILEFFEDSPYFPLGALPKGLIK